MPAKQKATIVITTTRRSVGAALEQVLKQAGFRVEGNYEEIEEALEFAAKKRPELLLADATIDWPDPFAAVAEWSEKKRKTRVVFYAGQCSESLVDLSKEAGACGLLLLPDVSPEDLPQLLRAVLKGEKKFPDSVPRETGFIAKLSPRERQVLRSLAIDRSIKDTAEMLGVRPTTVETHRQAVRAKLDLRGPAGMTLLAVREGLIDA